MTDDQKETIPKTSDNKCLNDSNKVSKERTKNLPDLEIPIPLKIPEI